MDLFLEWKNNCSEDKDPLTFGNKNSVMVMTPQDEFIKYLNSSRIEKEFQIKETQGNS